MSKRLFPFLRSFTPLLIHSTHIYQTPSTSQHCADLWKYNDDPCGCGSWSLRVNIPIEKSDTNQIISPYHNYKWKGCYSVRPLQAVGAHDEGPDLICRLRRDVLEEMTFYLSSKGEGEVFLRPAR